MRESAELKVGTSVGWKTVLLLLQNYLVFFYAKCTVTMEMRSKFL